MTYKEKVTSAGRTYHIEREIVPTQVKSVDGPGLVTINLKDPALEPTNMKKPDGTPMTILQTEGIRIDLSKRTHEAMNFWHRSGDYDEVILCVEGQIKWETELGNVTLNAGEMLVIPRGIAHRSLPGTPPEGGNNLVIELKINNPVQEVINKGSDVLLEVDLLVEHAEYVITVDKDRRIFRDGALAIQNSKIIDVGKTIDLQQKYIAKKTINAKHKVITPGLIDGHIHTAFQLSRGLADEVGAQKFLFERMYPYEGYLDEDDNYWSAMLCCLELLRHGVTTFIDPGNYHPGATARAVEQVGMRCVLGKSTMDIAKSNFGALPPTFIETMEEGLQRSEEVIKQYHESAGGRIRAWLCFRGVNNCTDQLIQRMKEMADHYGVGLQAHACFAKETRDASIASYSMPEVERLHKLNVLDHNLLLIHMGWATAKEVLLIADHDVKITAAPSSSLHNAYGNLSMGVVPELLEMGVAVGIGSDHASSGIVDICQEMFLLAGSYKEARLDPKVLPPEKVLEMATINGARCALWEDQVGSLEIGKEADLVMFDTQTPEWQPIYNPVSNLVYSAHGGTVDTVIIGGKVVVENGRVLTLNDIEIYEQVRELQPKILEKTGLESIAQTTWPIY